MQMENNKIVKEIRKTRDNFLVEHIHIIESTSDIEKHTVWTKRSKMISCVTSNKEAHNKLVKNIIVFSQRHFKLNQPSASFSNTFTYL